MRYQRAQQKKFSTENLGTIIKTIYKSQIRGEYDKKTEKNNVRGS